MIARFKVVASVVAGRRRHLEILLPYLRAQQGLIDWCDLWCNTTDCDDINYIRQVCAGDPFFRAIEARIPVYDGRAVYHFFRSCVDPNTVYIRFDDDICWVAPDAVEKLVRFRLERREYPLVFANTINNGVCSYIHQRLGCIPANKIICRYEALGGPGAQTGQFARLVHESFLQALEERNTSEYLFSQWVECDYKRVSANCICWLGCNFAELKGEVGKDDEAWLTTIHPIEVGVPNAICGAALVAHFASRAQRPWLEANTKLIDRYQLLSRRLPSVAAGLKATDETEELDSWAGRGQRS